jgi:hypothetical protein
VFYTVFQYTRKSIGRWFDSGHSDFIQTQAQLSFGFLTPCPATYFGSSVPSSLFPIAILSVTASCAANERLHVSALLNGWTEST